ncbi:MAG: hypothetical protein IJ686_03910 [Bacteroidales bacterium]|nr:hypothetical protein [Bacteroidales bacterium]
MSYKFRVTLKGIKGFFRVYLVNGSNSLYTFHKQLHRDLEFPQDQPILFKAFDETGAVAGRFALTPLPGNKAVDEVSVAQTVKDGIVCFEYFYDVISKKSVIITLEGESPVNVSSPECIESKGPLPIEFENGYVAFEDLPDDKRKLPGEGSSDDDDDDDEDFDDSEDSDEDDDDEDGDDDEAEEIVDESEL